MKKRIYLFSILILIISNLSYSYNPEHLKILKSVRDVFWQQWRKKNPGIKPDLRNAVIENVDITGDFTHVNFRNAQITNNSISRADFTASDFSYSIIKKCNVPMVWSRVRIFPIFRNSIFYKAQIIDSHFFGTDFINVNFNEAEIINTKIEGSIFKQVSFIKAKIINSELWYGFHNADLSNVQIVKSEIFSGYSSDRNILNSKFNNAKITECIIYGWFNNVSFINADLTSTTFFYFKLPEGSTLTNVNFTNANLTNVNFQKSTFKNVIFKNADMNGAKIERKWYNYIKKQGVRNFDKIKWE